MVAMTKHRKSRETAVTFDNKKLTIEEIRNLESDIVRRVAMRFLTPAERSDLLRPDEMGMDGEALCVGDGVQYGWDRGDNFDKDPHDKDPHDKDVHDRNNHDRGNFDRI
jgi:hypothetical protein